MFEPTLTLPNFTLGKFSVVKKPILDGGAISREASCHVGLLEPEKLIPLLP